MNTWNSFVASFRMATPLLRKCFGFTGQGSQWVGMGKVLLETHACASIIMKEANAVLGYDLAKVMTEGDEVYLSIVKLMLEGASKYSQLATLHFYIFYHCSRNIEGRDPTIAF